MAGNPIHIPAVFAESGNKNPIQKTLQVGQNPQSMTWTSGTPLITMTPIADGGKAPQGQDFNGVLNAVCAHTVFGQNGGRYKWSQEVVDNYGGYPAGAIVQSNDELREYRSLVDNNTQDPNIMTGSVWVVYAGQGSVPNASSTTAGIMRVLNVLTSTEVGAALSAAMGRYLQEGKLDASKAFAVNQTRINVTASRSKGVVYTNNTPRPIEVCIVVNGGASTSNNTIVIDDVIAFTFNIHTSMTAPFTFTVPSGGSYQINITSTINSWSELR